MKNKKMIVYKHNPVIRGHFEKDDAALTVLSEFDLDMLNVVYKLTQDRLKGVLPNIYDIQEMQRYSCVELSKELKMSTKRYKEIIQKSIQNIYEVNIVLKNYIDPITGKKIDSYQSRIFKEIGFNKEDDENIIYIGIAPLFLNAILRRKTNYTAIDLNTTRKIRSKYGKRLYEHLASLKGYKNEFTLRVKELNELFGFNEKGVRRFTQIMARCYDSVNENIAFSYEVHSKDKCISFVIKK